MAALAKTELLRVTHTEWAKLCATLDTVPTGIWTRTGDDGISIRDILCHRAHWIDLYLGWYADGQAGRFVHMPAKGYKWNQLKAYNAMLRAAHADVPPRDAVSRLEAAHAKLLAHINGLSDAVLYAAPMPGAQTGWTTGRYAEASGPSHYRSANTYIRARLRGLTEMA